MGSWLEGKQELAGTAADKLKHMMFLVWKIWSWCYKAYIVGKGSSQSIAEGPVHNRRHAGSLSTDRQP